MILFNPLLALLGIEVSGCAEPPLVFRHIGSNDRVLARLGEMLIVALDSKWPGVEAWPVNLKRIRMD